MSEENANETETETSGDARSPKVVLAALNRVMKALASSGIGKYSENRHSNYNFRGIDAVCDAVGPLLAKEGVFVAPRCLDRNTVERRTRDGKASFWVSMAMEVTFYGLDGSSVTTGPFFGEAADTGDKAVGKAESIAYRNCMIKVFCIPVNGPDADADATTPEPVEPTVQPAKTPKSPKTREPEPPPATKAEERSQLMRTVLKGVPGNARHNSVALVKHLTGKAPADLTEEEKRTIDDTLTQAIDGDAVSTLLVKAGLLEAAQ